MQSHYSIEVIQKLRNAYYAMMHRCYKKHHYGYRWYGAKGIEVCCRWKESFWNFLEDMGPTYNLGLTLERKYTNMGYQPDNCEWATIQRQQRNKSNSKYVYVNGERRLLQDIAEQYNIPAQTIYNRLKSGWNIEKSISTPLKQHLSRINILRKCDYCNSTFSAKKNDQRFCCVEHKNKYHNKQKNKY